MADAEGQPSGELKALAKQHEAFKVKAAEEQQLVEVREKDGFDIIFKPTF